MKIELIFENAKAVFEFERNLDKRNLLVKLSEQMGNEVPKEVHIYYDGTEEEELPATVKTPSGVKAVPQEPKKIKKGSRKHQRWSEAELQRLEAWYFDEDTFPKNSSTMHKSKIRKMAKDLGRTVDAVKVRIIVENGLAFDHRTMMKPIKSWCEKKWHHNSWHKANASVKMPQTKEEAQRQLAIMAKHFAEARAKKDAEQDGHSAEDTFEKVLPGKATLARDTLNALMAHKDSLMNKHDAQFVLEIETEEEWISFVEQVLKRQSAICAVLKKKGSFKTKDKSLVWKKREW